MRTSSRLFILNPVTDKLLHCMESLSYIMKRLFSFFLALMGIAETSAEVLHGRCSYVQDGDTFKFIKNGQTQEERVRLYGIDAPEKGQAYAAQSRKLLEKWARGKIVRIEVVEVDQYGRYVAKVYAGNKYVNLEMVKAGLAWFYDFHSTDAELAEAQELARKTRKGVWKDDNAENPRSFRQRNGTVHEDPAADDDSDLGSAGDVSVENGGMLMGTCEYVMDGDTIKVRCSVEDDEPIVVQLYGVDAPEKGKPFSLEARARLKALIEKKSVRVEALEKDRYGRLLGKVYVGRVCVNLVLLKEGLARFYKRLGKDPQAFELEAAEKAARAAGVGLWRTDT